MNHAKQLDRPAFGERAAHDLATAAMLHDEPSIGRRIFIAPGCSAPSISSAAPKDEAICVGGFHELTNSGIYVSMGLGFNAPLQSVNSSIRRFRLFPSDASSGRREGAPPDGSVTSSRCSNSRGTQCNIHRFAVTPMNVTTNARQNKRTDDNGRGALARRVIDAINEQCPYREQVIS
jgi:hypothetical protein